jgi:hypothetical protein
MINVLCEVKVAVVAAAKSEELSSGKHLLRRPRPRQQSAINTDLKEDSFVVQDRAQW